jgi:DNA-binding transcriptional LysR family regulator
MGSGPGALLMTPLMCAAAGYYPGMKVSITRGPTELQIQQLRSRQLDAMVVDIRRVTPATDLNIESLGDIRAGFIVNATHPLAARRPVSFQDITQYPVASTPLSDEVVRQLVDQYGVLANPSAMATLMCEDIASMLATVAQTQAIYLGVVAAARAGLQDGSLVELPIKPTLKAAARFAYVTLAGRTEAPVMSWFRGFVREHLHD